MSFDKPRELDDPKAMRALAHPVRLALLEALADAQSLTATEAGERVGESPANASFHLRQLAKYGFVEEAPGGTGRKRPWRLKHLGMRWTDVHDDQELAGAARQLGRITFDRYLDRARRGLEERHALPQDWRAVTGVNQMRLYLTPEELKAVDEEIVEILLNRFADRRTPSPEQPAEAERVEILTFAYRV
ncbi:winged helix-turn-helix domain-containing protein [Solirubrobacter soli]|uniref:winged helix-turn-helix domain-containing protein n=1 Tax=Solirubrobacter soli TaxID=363832 RepID=UPI00041B007E|nr:helix-turn-helix domain-containing protein [Solirubrobacter soli]